MRIFKPIEHLQSALNLAGRPMFVSAIVTHGNTDFCPQRVQDGDSCVSARPRLAALASNGVRRLSHDRYARVAQHCKVSPLRQRVRRIAADVC